MFSEHGRYWLAVDKNILLLELSGAWNAQGTHKCIEDFYLAADTFKGRPFALLFDTRNITGYTADSFEAWMNTMKTMGIKGVKAMARCDDTKSDQYRVFIAKYDQLIAQYVPFHVSGDFDDALSFLHTQGYEGFEQGCSLVVPFSTHN